MEKQPQQRFTVDLPLELHDALRQQAAFKRVRMRELVVSCLSECLSRDNPQPQQQRPSPAPPAPGSGVKREE